MAAPILAGARPAALGPSLARSIAVIELAGCFTGDGGLAPWAEEIVRAISTYVERIAGGLRLVGIAPDLPPMAETLPRAQGANRHQGGSHRQPGRRDPFQRPARVRRCPQRHRPRAARTDRQGRGAARSQWSRHDRPADRQGESRR